jgi:biotin carboxyl carrier protein
MDVKAEMAGTVLEVHVSSGDEVDAETPLVLLESMKMEIEVASPLAGRVTSVGVAAGDPVANGQVLVVVEPA